MFGPLARTTPTRLPWWWAMLVAWVLLAALAPAMAGESDDLPVRESASADGAAKLLTGWQLVPLQDTLRLLRERDPAAPRLLTLAVMPMRQSAWWLGVGASRSSGARFELRWTMALDGSAPRAPIAER